MTRAGHPRISVLLPVYNGQKYLQASITSILQQTHTDFELLILNDGSTDDSSKIVQGFSDARIRYFEHPNQGLPATLNLGARHAHGEFLFRQDQDDLSMPDRFAKQLAFLDANPEVAVLGTWAKIISEEGRTLDERFHRHPLTHAAISLNVLFDTPFVHSSVAMRKTAFDAVA